MTASAARPTIAITSVGVPEELSGVPLGLEIVSPAGAVRRLLLAPEENRRTAEPVDEPGYYLVRVTLPSGESLAETATVPESSAVTLDFGATARPKPAAVPELRERGAVLRGLDFGFSLESAAVGEDIASETGISYGLFQRWTGNPPAANTLEIEGRTETSISFPGDLAVARHPGWDASPTEWRPLLVCVKLPDADALVVWPPSSGNQPLHLEDDPNPGANPAVAPLVASVQTADKAVAALYAYARGGRLDTVRQQAESLLGAKLDNPVNAALAAYTLKKIGAERPDWLANLANAFPHLPDGALLYGWHLIRDGQAQQARGFFLTALARGIPMYGEGVRLLRDGLSFLNGLGSGDAELQAAVARAYRLADAVNPRSVLTCLRLGAGLSVEWA